MKKQLYLLGVAVLACTAYADAQCTSTVTNDATNGTQYYIPRYKNSTSACIQNSSIYDNGNVGIGTASPGSNKLSVSGTIYGSSTITANSGFLNNSGQPVAHVSTSNSFFGSTWSGTLASTGAYVTSVGVYAGEWNSSGSYNTAVGHGATLYNATGSNNTSVGYYAGFGVTNNNHSNNCFFGYKAGYGITTGGNNLFMGYEAGYTNTTATYNIAVGYRAGYSNATGVNNTFIGYSAGYSATGSYTTCIGYAAGYYNVSANYNTMMGYTAGYNATGGYNTMIGHQAGKTSTTGTNNTLVGLNALYYNTTGDYNTAVGNYAGASGAGSNTIGDYNTFLGYNADANSNNYNNAMALGNGASALGSNTVYVGNASIATAWCQVTWSNGSDRRIKNNVQENVPGLAFINMLRPVTFHYDIDKQNELMGITSPANADSNGVSKPVSNWPGKYDIEKIQFTGLIAQEVDSAAKELGYDFSGVDASGPVMGLRYAEFTVPLIQAVQELSQTVDSLKQEIEVLQAAENTGPPTANTQQVTLSSSATILYQNEPNPFSSNTVIRYFIPENIQGDAYIVFYDMYGNEINKLKIDKKGSGQLNVNTENLATGIYSYSLIVNGEMIDTKKMAKSK